MREQTTVQENKMGVMHPGKLLLNMALPLAISMLVQALYNVVDTIYISRISESAVTALSLAFPIQNLMIGFATGIGVGMNSLFSRALGEGNRERANCCAGNGILLMAVAVALFMVFGFLGSRPYYEMQSTVQETVDSGIDYVSICCIFSLGIFVEILFERLLQASGRTVYSMITQTVGAVINIVMDPVFIFGWFGIPAMGVAGAAVATVLGQWVAAILAILFNLKRNPDVHLTRSAMKPHGRLLRAILGIGVPSIIMMAIGSVMNFCINQILQGFNETATGVFGVYFRLQSFFFMPVYGVNNAAISIVAFNYGARKPERITETIKRSCLAAFGIMMVGVLAFQFLPDQLLSIFNPSDGFLRIGRSALRIISIHFPLAAFGIALGAIFQALGNGLYSTITSLCRQLAVLIPVAYLLSLSGEVSSVWWSFPVAELVSLALSIVFFIRIYRQKVRPMFAKQERLAGAGETS